MKRRDLLKGIGAIIGVGAVGKSVQAEDAQQDPSSAISHEDISIAQRGPISGTICASWYDVEQPMFIGSASHTSFTSSTEHWSIDLE